MSEKFIYKIEAGKYEVIDSGIFIIPEKNSSITFFIDDLIIELVLKQDDSKDEQNTVTFEIISEKHMQVICNNWFPATSGSGLPEPVPIFSRDNITIYMNFIFESLDCLPQITYTFYRKNG